jgi:Uma2 family endonuclease
MNLAPTIQQVEYPESDGQPMGETDLHRNWMNRLFDLLRHRYRGQHVYVGCDLLVYYEEGDPARNIVPDVFVVLNCQPGDRRVFKTWEEGKCPDAVFEVTSRSTRRQDTGYKPRVYAGIGIPEYFVYDPTSDYLLPPLRGFRLTGDAYEAIEPDASEPLECRELGLRLRLEAGRLVVYDGLTGQLLLTEAEAERQAREAAEARAAAEATARQAAELEVQRLRELLRRQTPSP